MCDGCFFAQISISANKIVIIPGSLSVKLFETHALNNFEAVAFFKQDNNSHISVISEQNLGNIVNKLLKYCILKLYSH